MTDISTTNTKTVRRQTLAGVTVVLGLSILVLLFIWKKSDDERFREISRLRVQDVTAFSIKQFQDNYQPVENTLKIFSKWGAQGLLLTAKDNPLLPKLVPVIENMPQVSRFHLSRSDGSAYILQKDTSGWLTITKKKEESERWTLYSQDQKPLKTWREKSDYNPKTRPWYSGAVDSVAAGDIFWTSPYTFYHNGEYGVTAAISWRSKSGITVASFDVFLKDVFTAIVKNKPTANGQVFIIDGEGFPLCVTDNKPGEKPGSANILFSPDRKTIFPTIKAAIDRWVGLGRPQKEPFRVTIQDKIFWEEMVPLQNRDRAAQLYVGFIIPESDILEFEGAPVWEIVLLSVVIFITTLVLVFFLMRRHSRLLKKSSGEDELSPLGEETALMIIARGESDQIEFKATMRRNLATQKFGKEIELAWLKGVTAFMNTRGGTLFLGVGDDGQILGLETDAFENDDRCRLHFKNLLKQHIGLEQTRFVRFQVLNLSGMSVAVIRCRKADRPVFLKNKEDESFYIRSGPSSVKLSGSQTLKYLNDQ